MYGHNEQGNSVQAMTMHVLDCEHDLLCSDKVDTKTVRVLDICSYMMSCVSERDLQGYDICRDTSFSCY